MRYQIQVNRKNIYRIQDTETKQFIAEFSTGYLFGIGGWKILEFACKKSAQEWIDAKVEEEEDNIWRNV